MIQGLAGGIVIAVMNTLGAALVVVWPNPSDRLLRLGDVSKDIRGNDVL